MSVKERTLSKLEKSIRELHHKEQKSTRWYEQKIYTIRRFALMLYHEAVSDDVEIRAQSFSYLTLFSALPMLAGLFILFSFMSQWGPIEKGFEVFLGQILAPVPEDYRDTLMEFILSFKDQYANGIQEKSTSIGVLALGVLIWVTAKVFFNIEDLMNRVWSARTNRGWGERVQNFILASVVLPLVAAISFSLPSIIERWGGRGIKVSVFLGEFLPLILFALVLSLMFRFFPNVKVTWRSALSGAFFSTVLFGLGNILLKIYFRFGTNTAYGKVAALPIIAFFIYVVWFIFILGAEVSYLVQNQRNFTGKRMPSTTLAEAILLMDLIQLFETRFTSGARPISLLGISSHFNISSFSTQKLIRFLMVQGVIVESINSHKGHDSAYVLARNLEGVDEVKLVQNYLHLTEVITTFEARPILAEILRPLSESERFKS